MDTDRHTYCFCLITTAWEGLYSAPPRDWVVIMANVCLCRDVSTRAIGTYATRKTSTSASVTLFSYVCGNCFTRDTKPELIICRSRNLRSNKPFHYVQQRPHRAHVGRTWWPYRSWDVLDQFLTIWGRRYVTRFYWNNLSSFGYIETKIIYKLSGSSATKLI